jgi:cobalt-zinc-cadmium efflux system protein
MAGHHHHAPASAAATSPGARRRALTIALAANGALLVVQVVAAIAFGSLALLADTAHLATDVLALALALGALLLSARPASARTTYGWERAEVVAAVANAILLGAASVAIAVEAVDRFSNPHTIDGVGVALVGVLGLVVNAGSAAVVARASGANLNLRGAFWHLASDAIGSAAVIVAGVV